MTTGTPKRVIRIFLSSTFGEFQRERDGLREIFEELRSRCESNGFSFHPIDLRWGVSYADSDANTAVQICLDEIDRCKALSPELNFLIMAGECYGWQPLPETITKEVWHRLTDHLDSHSEQMELLNLYYQQDTNDLDEPYRLMSRSLIDAKMDHTVTDSVVHDLLNQLLDAARGTDTGGTIVAWERVWKELKWQYSSSATEQEIARGYFREKHASKYNTFILLKGQNRSNGEKNAPGRDPAGELRQQLKDTITEEHKVQIYEKRSENDDGWLAAVRAFLTDAVDAQIARCSKLDQWDWEREILLSTCQFVNANYVDLPTAEDAEAFVLNNSGRCLLLLGQSGSGKSWLLKHFAAEQMNTHTVAAVFNDVEPGGRSFVSALEMLVRSLRMSGRLDSEEVPVDLDNPVGWFEAELRKLSPGKQVYILLDSINDQNMPDYHSVLGKSIFRMNLPEFVTVVVSAASKADLRECDKKQPLLSYPIPELEPEDSVQRFYTVLAKHGHRLSTPDHRDQAESCLQCSPDLRSALSIEIFAQICAKLHSWDNFPISGVVDFHTLIRYALFHQHRDGYRLLRSHALGYMALSSVGLTEPELIDLLSADEEVTAEIRSQTEKNKAKWEFEGPIPTVLWAIQYAELKPFLMEINDEGMMLLQLRHTRLREGILAELGEELCQALLRRMRDYDSKQSWLLYSGSAVIPNRRKVQESLPIYENLNDTRALARFLEQPVCIDAFVRAQKRGEIKGYLERFGAHIVSAQMLSLLCRKELLFRLWPDSFIPAVIAQLRLEDDPCDDLQKKRELLLLTGHRCYTRCGSGPGDGAFFPELDRKCRFALDANGMVAVLMNGVIRIIDLRKQEILPTYCPSVKEECFLYWVGHTLVVRCEKQRLRYTYRNEQLTFETRERPVRDWGALISSDPELIDRAGGWTEAEHFGFGIMDTLHSNVVRYHMGNEVFTQDLFESYNDSVRVRVQGTLAAIMIDNKTLIVADLRKKVKLYEETIRGLTGVEWSSSGRDILAIVRGNTLRTIHIDVNRPIGAMAGPNTSYLRHRVINDGGSIATQMGQDVHEMFVYRPDAYTSADGPSSDVPLFGAMSRRHGWVACYFYSRTGAFIRILDTRTSKASRIGDVSEITYQDCRENPFYPAPDGSGLILMSHGTGYWFDLKTHRMKKKPAKALRSQPLDPEGTSILKSYVEYMARSLHLRTGTWPDVGTRGPLRLFRSAKPSEEQRTLMQQLIPYYRLKQSEVLQNGDVYWLIDRDRGLIHAFHRSGTCLCRDMLPGGILSAEIDAQDGRLYLLLNTGSVVCADLRDVPSL